MAPRKWKKNKGCVEKYHCVFLSQLVEVAFFHQLEHILLVLLS